MLKAKNNKNIRRTKLVQLLSVLSPLEIKRFKKFLESPFHNNNEQLLKLFLLLKKFHPEYDAPSLTKENLFLKLFKKRQYSQQRMNDLMYDLSKLVEDFLIVSNALNSKTDRQTALVNILAKRNHPFFAIESKKLVDHIQSKSTFLTASDYLQLQQIYDQWWFHVDTEKNQNQAVEFKAAHNNLDLFYLMTKLQYFAEQEGRKKIFDELQILTFREVVFKHALESKEDAPLLFLLFNIIRLIKEELKVDDFLSLKNKVVVLGKKIEESLRRDIFNHLLNYCIRKNNRGQTEFLQEALKIYKIMLTDDLLTIDGIMPNVHFINISNFALKCGEIEWAKKFQTNYKSFLDKSSAEEVLNVTQIFTLFYQQDFNKANGLINTSRLQTSASYYPGILSLIHI